jgi:Ca2+-binding RTX toxin-like protein
MDGTDGGDTIDGGADLDTVVFSSSRSGVHADLETGIGQGGFAEGDVYRYIENIIGTNFADELSGDGIDNVLEGAAGNDLLLGRGGNDTLYGGRGDDIFYAELNDGDDLYDGGDARELFGNTFDGNDTIAYKYYGGDGRIEVIDVPFKLRHRIPVILASILKMRWMLLANPGVSAKTC